MRLPLKFFRSRFLAPSRGSDDPDAGTTPVGGALPLRIIARHFDLDTLPEDKCDLHLTTGSQLAASESLCSFLKGKGNCMLKFENFIAIASLPNGSRYASQCCDVNYLALSYSHPLSNVNINITTIADSSNPDPLPPVSNSRSSNFYRRVTD